MEKIQELEKKIDLMLESIDMINASITMIIRALCVRPNTPEPPQTQ